MKIATDIESAKILRDLGIVPTSQRVQLTRLALEKHQHVTAETLYKEAKLRKILVSRATVYNTLSLLVVKGLLRELTVETGQVFFDSNTSPHHHFFDVDNGELTDIRMGEVDSINIPELPVGKSVVGVQIVIRLKSTG